MLRARARARARESSDHAAVPAQQPQAAVSPWARFLGESITSTSTARQGGLSTSTMKTNRILRPSLSYSYSYSYSYLNPNWFTPNG